MVLVLAKNYGFGQYTKDRYHTKANIAANHVDSYKIYDITEKAEGIKDSTLAEELWFDERGNLTKEVDHRNDMTVTVTYSYDQQDRLTETKTDAPDIDFFETTINVYENDFLVSTICRNADKHITLQTDNTYLQGLKIESRTTYDDGHSFVTLYTYDAKGRLVQEGVPTIKRKTDYKYDEAGNLIEFIEQENDRTIKDVFEVENNLRVGQFIYANDKLDYVYKMTYDSKSLIREELSCANGVEDCQTITRYSYQYRK